MSGRHLIIAAVAIAFSACWMEAAAVYSDDDAPDQAVATQSVATQATPPEPIPADVAVFDEAHPRLPVIHAADRVPQVRNGKAAAKWVVPQTDRDWARTPRT